MEEPTVKRRAWVLLIGLPLVAGVIGIAFMLFLSSYRALPLLFGLPISAMNYRLLKSRTTKPPRERDSG